MTLLYCYCYCYCNCYWGA